MVFEDLNVYHSQEECVSTDHAQQPNSEKENSSHVGEMMSLGKKCFVFRACTLARAGSHFVALACLEFTR